MCKIALTAGQFAWCLALNKTPGITLGDEAAVLVNASSHSNLDNGIVDRWLANLRSGVPFLCEKKGMPDRRLMVGLSMSKAFTYINFVNYYFQLFIW